MIAFLWSNRERPNVLSRRWFIVWLKRVYHVLALGRIIGARLRWSLAGARVGDLSILYRLRVNGPSRNLVIGERSFVGPNVYIATHAEVRIGSRVCVNEGVRILTASHDVADAQWRTFSLSVQVDDFAWIATGAVILPGVHIGRGAVVGAGAVVSVDVPEGAVAVGNPATVRVSRRPESLEYDPVIFAAPYEAWIGRNAQLKKQRAKGADVGA